MKRAIRYLAYSVLLFLAIYFIPRIYQTFAYQTDRDVLLAENTLKAKSIIARYPDLPFDKRLNLDEQKQLLFSLMFLEKNPGALSQLDMLYRAHSLPLLFERPEKGVFKNRESLSELYDAYQRRLAVLDDKNHYIQRTELIGKRNFKKFENSFNPQSVENILVVSDFQMRDEESPFHLYPAKPYFPTSYYPANPHVPYMVEAAFKTLRTYEQQQHIAMDLSIFTGDITDNGHYNEVRWGIEAFSGGTIHPDSGTDDDIFPGLFANGEPNDTADIFTARGLKGNTEAGTKTIPWYFVAGNHDGLAMGVFPMTYQPINLGFLKLERGTYGFMNDISIGDINYLGIIPNLRGMLQHMDLPEEQKKIIPDANRRLLNPVEIAKEMFISDGEPVGHGMQFVKDIETDRSYSFITQSNAHGIAIRHIALDTNARNPQGSFSNQKIKWLVKELKAAKNNKQLVIVSSHHKPIDIFDNGNRLVRLLKKHPHVIAHLVAHWHCNNIEARAGKHAKNGYWEIETDSMVKWPQQLRILEVSVDTSLGIGVIKSTMINHQSTNPYSVSERGRFLTYLEGYLKGGERKLIRREGEAEDRNTLLYFKLPKDFL